MESKGNAVVVTPNFCAGIDRSRRIKTVPTIVGWTIRHLVVWLAHTPSQDRWKRRPSLSIFKFVLLVAAVSRAAVENCSRVTCINRPQVLCSIRDPFVFRPLRFSTLSSMNLPSISFLPEDINSILMLRLTHTWNLNHHSWTPIYRVFYSTISYLWTTLLSVRPTQFEDYVIFRDVHASIWLLLAYPPVSLSSASTIYSNSKAEQPNHRQSHIHDMARTVELISTLKPKPGMLYASGVPPSGADQTVIIIPGSEPRSHTSLNAE